mmetsp:Transcript_23568/g.67499  ORF Transcript_23568/g.67499 Transcript_23568/m.67499 type:complete len:297 (-) Transcript_23568:282-1172(-)
MCGGAGGLCSSSKLSAGNCPDDGGLGDTLEERATSAVTTADLEPERRKKPWRRGAGSSGAWNATKPSALRPAFRSPELRDCLPMSSSRDGAGLLPSPSMLSKPDWLVDTLVLLGPPRANLLRVRRFMLADWAIFRQDSSKTRLAKSSCKARMPFTRMSPSDCSEAHEDSRPLLTLASGSGERRSAEPAARMPGSTHRCSMGTDSSDVGDTDAPSWSRAASCLITASATELTSTGVNCAKPATTASCAAVAKGCAKRARIRSTAASSLGAAATAALSPPGWADEDEAWLPLYVWPSC